MPFGLGLSPFHADFAPGQLRVVYRARRAVEAQRDGRPSGKAEERNLTVNLLTAMISHRVGMPMARVTNKNRAGG